MGDRRRGIGRRTNDRRAAPPAQAAPSTHQAESVEVLGWTTLAHPLFLTQIENLISAAEAERSGRTAAPGPNTKLLGHLLDLAFDKIPRDPGNPIFRHGGTLGKDRRNWFRAKTGNGRYRLFYRFHSSARIIVFAWVNDEDSLRTYGSRTDAYAVFAKMLDAGNPPDDWNELVSAASKTSSVQRLGAVVKRPTRKPKCRVIGDTSQQTMFGVTAARPHTIGSVIESRDQRNQPL
jgi:toxin YhaV